MEELFERISESVDTGEEEETVKLTQQALDEGWEPVSIIQKGFSVGVESAAKKYNECIYFIPELMLMAEAVKAGLATLLNTVSRCSWERNIAGLSRKSPAPISLLHTSPRTLMNCA